METATDHAEPAPAGFWVRVAAVVLDGVLFVLVEILLAFFAGLVWGPGIVETPVFRPTVSVFMLVFGAAYYFVMHAVFGQTLGKMVLGLHVIEAGGRPLTVAAAALRSFGYSISALTFGIGFLLAGLRRDKRALHDLIAGSRVVRSARLAEPVAVHYLTPTMPTQRATDSDPGANRRVAGPTLEGGERWTSG
jgi:uncharacterized RDD family membrane protein YckC